MKPVLLDTGPLVALLDPTDTYHRICAETIGDIYAPLVTSEVVIAETCHLLRLVKGAVHSVLNSVHSREFAIPLTLADAARQVSRIMSRYADVRIGLADAFLVHLADEFETGDILTLDRDFRFYRWGRNNAFHMLIPLSEK